MNSLIHSPRTGRTRAIQLSLVFWLLITAVSLQAQPGRNVELLGQLRFSQAVSDVWGYADDNGNEYALVGQISGTAIVDVTDPTNPTRIAFISGPLEQFFGLRDIKTHSHYAYIITEGRGTGSGLQVVDMSDPHNASLVFTFDSTFTTAHNLYIDDGYAYVVGTAGAVTGFHILDLANPEHPIEVGAYAQPYIHDIFVRNDTAFAAAILDGTGEILDVSDKTDIRKLSFVQSPLNAVHNTWTTEDGNYLLTTDETTGGHLLIWDIRDIFNLELVARYESGNRISIHNVHVKGDYAHISYYKDGYRVVDISDPTEPAEVGFYDTFPRTTDDLFAGAWGVYPYAPSGNTYISDMESGLFVVRFDEEASAGTVSGFVLEEGTGVPVAGAQVKFVEANKYLTTDPGGSFSLKIFGGHHTIVTSAFGFFQDTVEIDLTPGSTQSVVSNLPRNTAALQVSLDSVDIELEVGSFDRQTFVVSNAGGGIMEFRVRDIVGPFGGSLLHSAEDTEQNPSQSQLEAYARMRSLSASMTNKASSSRVVKTSQQLETIIEDPEGDVQMAPDVIAINAEMDAEQVTIQVVVAGSLDPSDFGGAVSLDVDQDKETGLNPPVFGTPAQDIGADFAVYTFNLSSGAVQLFELPDGVFIESFPVIVDSNSFTFSLPLAALNNDDGNMNVTALHGNSQSPTDWVPDAGHGTIGIDVFADVPWLRENPTQGVLLGGESQDITLDIVAIRLKPDTVYTGVVLVEVTNLDLPTKAIPIKLTTFSSTAVADEGSELPQTFALQQNYPNPFNPSTTIRYQLPRHAEVELQIFDLQGRVVKTLVRGTMSPGYHSERWDGKDSAGRRVSSGVYLYRLEAGEFTITRRLVLMR